MPVNSVLLTWVRTGVSTPAETVTRRGPNWVRFAVVTLTGTGVGCVSLRLRYRAVLEVLDGTPVTEVAERFGVARQTVHRWVARYRENGIDGLADRSHAPKAHPWRVSAEIEAVICDLRASHRRWGPRRLVFELAKRGHPDVSRSTVYRVLVRHRLLEPVPRRRRRDQYRRWERSAAMELWQMDVTASLFLADGLECGYPPSWQGTRRLPSPMPSPCRMTGRPSILRCTLNGTRMAGPWSWTGWSRRRGICGSPGSRSGSGPR